MRNQTKQGRKRAECRRPRLLLPALLLSFLLLLPPFAVAAPSIAPSRLERSYWVHASLGQSTPKGYWGPDFPATAPPTRAEVENAARLLTGSYAANRLYLIYHQEMPVADARRVFAWWREVCPPAVELVPALPLRMYDQAQTPVFDAAELRGLAGFFRKTINPSRIAVYDVYAKRDQGEALAVLAESFPDRLVRVGLQPGEELKRHSCRQWRTRGAPSVTGHGTARTGCSPASAPRRCASGCKPATPTPGPSPGI